MLIAYCTTCGSQLGQNDEKPMADVLAGLADEDGCLILGSADDPDAILCLRCTCAAWRGEPDSTRCATFVDGKWESWAGRSAAATAIRHSDVSDVVTVFQTYYDIAVVKLLNASQDDPRVMPDRERVRRVSDAIEQVDPQRIAEHVAWLCEVTVPGGEGRWTDC